MSGINNKSLKVLFRNDPSINDDNSYWLSSLCQNVVSDENTEAITEFPKVDYTLCTIGRLDKDYVLEAARAYTHVASAHPEQKFNCVFIGGSETGKEKEIRELFNGCTNINLFMLGYIYPIPKALLREMDLFVSSAGSAGVSYNIDKPTISIDCHDLKAIGVLGYTTRRCLNRDDEPKQEIDSLIEKILFQNYLAEFNYVEKIKADNMKVMDTHLDFLKASCGISEYYDILSLSPSGNDRYKKVIAKIIGDNRYANLYLAWTQKRV